MLTLNPLTQEIVISSKASDIKIAPVTLHAGKLAIALYTVIAKSTKKSKITLRPAEKEPSLELLKQVLDELLPICGLPLQECHKDALDHLCEWNTADENKESRLDQRTLDSMCGLKTTKETIKGTKKKNGKIIEADLEAPPKSEKIRNPGITFSWADDRRTELRELFEDHLPLNIIKCLLPGIKRGKGSGYTINIPADNISIL